MKLRSLVLSGIVASFVLVGAGCSNSNEPEKATPTASATVAPTDAVVSASVTDKADVFAAALGEKGTWIIAATKDITTDKELVLEGTFKNGKKNDDGTDAIQRKIALYTQDADHKVTASFTLTAPKLTIKSPVARIQNGTFKGDLYVETEDFQLVGAKVEGNVYFKTDAAKAGFKMDDKSSVTGKQEVVK